MNNRLNTPLLRHQGIKQLHKISWFLVGALAFILSWKLLRLTGLPNISAYWDLHVYFLLIFSIIAFRHMLVIKMNILDIVIYMLIVFLLLNIFMHGFISSQQYIINYFLPLFFYFWGRYYGLQQNNTIKHKKYILAIITILMFISYLDYLTANGIIQLFNTDIINDISTKFGRSFNRTWDRGELPFTNIMVARPQGLAFSQHASACLLVGIAFYCLEESKIITVYRKSHKLMFIFSIILAMLYAIGTAYLVTLILIYSYIQSKKIKLIFIPILISGIIYVLYFREVQDVLEFFIAMVKNINNNDTLSIFTYLVIGESNPMGDAIGGEIYLFNMIFIMGIFSFMLFIAIIGIFLNNCKYLYNNRNNVKSIKLFVISVLLGSVHYNTTFVFPTIIIIFLTIGYVSSRTQLIKNNYIAGAING
jgi:hypothetical protein